MLESTGNIFNDQIDRTVISFRITGRYIPVHIHQATVCNGLYQLGHYTHTILLTDCIGTSTRKTDHISIIPGIFLQLILQLVDVLHKSIIGSINLTVIMGITMNTDRVSLIDHSFDDWKFIFIIIADKKGCFNAICLQCIQNSDCHIRTRTVIKGQINGISRIGLHLLYLHSPCSL